VANVTVKLDTAKLNQLIASMPERADKLTADAAYLIEGGAKMNIQAWPLIDTGALLNSIQAEKKKSGRWIIHDGVEYGVYWELGHHNIFTRHYMRMPFLGPAVVAVTNKFTEMLAQGLLR
jgi:hypothetical protein